MSCDLSEVRALAEEALRLEPLALDPGLNNEQDGWLYDNFGDLARAVLELAEELDAEREEHRETNREAEAQIALNERLREQVEVLDGAYRTACLHREEAQAEVEHERQWHRVTSIELASGREENEQAARWSRAWRHAARRYRGGIDAAVDSYSEWVGDLQREIEHLRSGLTAYRRLAQVTGTSIRWGDDSAHRAVVAWEVKRAERTLGGK